jgi:hypothetical protein
MAEYRMSLTRTDNGGEAVQARRAELIEAFEARKAVDPDAKFGAYDLGEDPIIAAACSKWAAGVEDTLISMGKKLGLKPRGGRDGKGDLEYGVGGSDRHPVEFWAQKVFT